MDTTADANAPAEQREANVGMLMLSCSGEMFIKTEDTSDIPFKMVLKAAFEFLDRTIINNQRNTTSLSIYLCHPDKDQRELVDFNMTPADVFLKLHQLIKTPDDELKDKYKVDRDPPLADCLLHAIQISRPFSRIFTCFFLATTTDDPAYSNVKERHDALMQLADINKMPARFDVLPFKADFKHELFYDEAYASLNKDIKDWYYDRESLSVMLSDTINYRQKHTIVQFHPYLGSKVAMKALLFSAIQKYKVYPKKALSNVTRKPLKKSYNFADENSEDEEIRLAAEDIGVSCAIRLPSKVSDKIIVPREIGLKAMDTSIIPLGVTVYEARPQSEGPYAQCGLANSPPRLLRQGGRHGKQFQAFWDAHKDLYLLAYVKARSTSKIFTAELVPVRVKNEKQFIVRFIPHVQQLFWGMEGNPNGNPVIPDANNKAVIKRAALFKDIINAMTIKEMDLGMIRPGPPARVIEYVKKELLGGDYKGMPVVDFIGDKLYAADLNVVDALTGKLGK